jgi:hypothetical protein
MEKSFAVQKRGVARFYRRIAAMQVIPSRSLAERGNQEHNSTKKTCERPFDLLEYFGRIWAIRPIHYSGRTSMSRVVTPPLASSTNMQPFAIPQEKIAMRAYEKWIKRGRPQGTEMQDWLEAEMELKAEMSRSKPPTKH